MDKRLRLRFGYLVVNWTCFEFSNSTTNGEWRGKKNKLIKTEKENACALRREIGSYWAGIVMYEYFKIVQKYNFLVSFSLSSFVFIFCSYDGMDVGHKCVVVSNIKFDPWCCCCSFRFVFFSCDFSVIVVEPSIAF